MSSHEPSAGNHRSVAGWLRRAGVLLMGLALLGAGGLMLVLPGPGALVILLGLAVLATEFAWARRALDRLKELGSRWTIPLRNRQGNARDGNRGAGRW